MKCQAILVNYHGGRLIREATETLLHDPDCDEIHVVDNSVSAEEACWLRSHLNPRIRLHINQENIGFARACNQAFAQSDAESILLLNPDARLFPGALTRLKKTLSDFPETGAVGPRVFWDFEKHFLLPPSTYPSRTEFLLDQLQLLWPSLLRLRSERFRQNALREWRQSHPFKVAALSGGLVLLRRQSVNRAGGLFDPQFFMYWEDSDLIRRLHDAGRRLLIDPRAEAVHLYDHTPRKDELIAQGWAPFAKKHFSSFPWRIFQKLPQHLGRRPPQQQFRRITIQAEYEDICLPVPKEIQSDWLLEYSPSPSFIPSMGKFGSGKTAILPLSLAKRFQGREYFLRLGSAAKHYGQYQTFSLCFA